MFMRSRCAVGHLPKNFKCHEFLGDSKKKNEEKVVVISPPSHKCNEFYLIFGLFLVRPDCTRWYILKPSKVCSIFSLSLLLLLRVWIVLSNSKAHCIRHTLTTRMCDNTTAATFMQCIHIKCGHKRLYLKSDQCCPCVLCYARELDATMQVVLHTLQRKQPCGMFQETRSVYKIHFFFGDAKAKRTEEFKWPIYRRAISPSFITP